MHCPPHCPCTSCSSTTSALPLHITYHCIAPSLLHRITPLLPLCIAFSLLQCIVPLMPLYIAHQYIAVSLLQCIAPSLLHRIAPLLPLCIAFSLLQCIVPSCPYTSRTIALPFHSSNASAPSLTLNLADQHQCIAPSLALDIAHQHKCIAPSCPTHWTPNPLPPYTSHTSTNTLPLPFSFASSLHCPYTLPTVTSALPLHYPYTSHTNIFIAPSLPLHVTQYQPIASSHLHTITNALPLHYPYTEHASTNAVIAPLTAPIHRTPEPMLCPYTSHRCADLCISTRWYELTQRPSLHLLPGSPNCP